MTNTQINSSAVERVELPDGRIQMKVVEKAKTEETTNDTQTELSKIPNRVSYEIYQPFVQFGFTDMGKSIGVEGCFWTYVKEEDRQSYWFRIYGKNPNEIEWIDASWTSLEGDNSSESAKLFFRELAKVTFSGSNSVYAYNWVNKNINKTTRTDIGGVKLILQIFRGGKFRTLKIGVNEDSNH